MKIPCFAANPARITNLTAVIDTDDFPHLTADWNIAPMNIRNLTNTPVTAFGSTIAPSGCQPLPDPLAGVTLIVDVFQASMGWMPARQDLCVAPEILADGSDRTAVALAAGGFVVQGQHAVRRQDRILLMAQTREQLLQLQDTAPASL